MYQDFFNKNDDYLSEFKQKVANQKIATMEERRAELAHSRNNFLGTFAGIALAGVVGWFVLAPQYAETEKEIPVIRRPQTAVKIKPENPGGMDIPNQDKDVYNIVEKKDVDNTVVENLLPTPEKPKLPDIVPEVSDINPNVGSLDEIVGDVAADKPINVDTPAVPDKPTDLLAGTQSTETPKVSETKSQPSEPAKAAAPVAPAKKTPATPSEKTSATAPQTTGGNWQIQLIASKNKASVEQAWKTLSAKYAVLQSYGYEIQESDLGSQGMFYRLRAGAFASKADAAKACANLKTQGLNDCIVKQR